MFNRCTVITPCNTPCRKLGNRATKGIIPVVQGLVSTKYPGREIVLQGNKSFLCQPCFRKLESLIRLRSQIVEKECKIMDGIEKSVACGVITLTENASPTRHTSPEPSSPPKVATPWRRPVLVSLRTRALGVSLATIIIIFISLHGIQIIHRQEDLLFLLQLVPHHEVHENGKG